MRMNDVMFIHVWRIIDYKCDHFSDLLAGKTIVNTIKSDDVVKC